MQSPRTASRRPSLARSRLTLVLLAAAAAVALVTPACAIYDDTWEGECITDCLPTVEEPACSSPLECFENETCGDDGVCHSGNCRFWGCVAGYSCVTTDRGTAECQQGDGSTTGEGGEGQGAADGNGGAGGDSTVDGSGGAGGSTVDGTGGAGGATGAGGEAAVIQCGNPGDCDAGLTCGEDGTCQPGSCEDVPCIEGYVCGERGTCEHQNAAACGDDDECDGASGALCVGGTCTAPEDLCFDRAQCPDGSSCADGKCIPSCADDEGCPDSFLCDEDRGICSLPAEPCAISDECGSTDRVCVAGACVPRSDGATCALGDVWVDNGCLPEQRVTFTCTVDGTQAECSAGLLCVHGACFVSCDPPDQDACAAIPGFEQCKTVDTAADTYAVCGSADNLGGECDPTLEVECDVGLVCVDGTCR